MVPGRKQTCTSPHGLCLDGREVECLGHTLEHGSLERVGGGNSACAWPVSRTSPIDGPLAYGKGRGHVYWGEVSVDWLEEVSK